MSSFNSIEKPSYFTADTVASKEIPMEPWGAIGTFEGDGEIKIEFPKDDSGRQAEFNYLTVDSDIPCWLSFYENGTETQTRKRFFCRQSLPLMTGLKHTEIYAKPYNEGDTGNIHLIFGG